MSRSPALRLEDMAKAIGNIRRLMDGRPRSDLDTNEVVRAAFERFMEIVSEASRHVPAEMKTLHPDIPWSDIANFGNVLRHVYHRLDEAVLWETYTKDLGPLEAAVADLIGRVGRPAS